MNKLIKAAGISVAILGSSFFAHAAEAAQKIGYVNTAKVFQALPQREVVVKKMQSEFKDKAAELKSIQNQAKAKIDKLKRDGELMSADQVEKLRIEIGQLDSKYKIKAQALDQASARREAEEKQKLFVVIQSAVKKVAEREGYDMIIDISALQYGKPADDISDKVLKEVK